MFAAGLMSNRVTKRSGEKKRKQTGDIRSNFYLFVKKGNVDLKCVSTIFVILGLIIVCLGTWTTWFNGFAKSPYSTRAGPIFMGTGFFVLLCGLANLLEARDGRNRHFIVGDCYMNAIYNKDRPNGGGFLKMLPFVLTTQQSALDQVDHDHLIREKIYMDSPKESMKTKKAKSDHHKTIEWADKHCQKCMEQSKYAEEKGNAGILRLRTLDKDEPNSPASVKDFTISTTIE
ncbi:Oidioi.mRNA.OKI2018_I69.chr2.g8109.t1.cds [Oikopleura dioica]|uniref:Oidioi.mRNA.OKI2018_I69.chr2.g8109.t1.cds n=1 Tax=Oikopleura dioica TaxID=34765 RepID=A0ABN7TCR5_OIKDI|nr:Oidioi.mRNA.OKI2018_I69.chr2.g8109.t1.cds [Oikopleura dioica]